MKKFINWLITMGVTMVISILGVIGITVLDRTIPLTDGQFFSLLLVFITFGSIFSIWIADIIIEHSERCRD